MSPTEDSDFVHVPSALPDDSHPNGTQSIFGEVLALRRQRVLHADEDSHQLTQDHLGERSLTPIQHQEEEEHHLDNAEGLFSSSTRRSSKSQRRIKSDGKSTAVSDSQSTSASDQKRYEKGSSTSGRSNETEIDEVGSDKTGQTSLDLASPQFKSLSFLQPKDLTDSGSNIFISTPRKPRSKRSKSSAKSDSASSQAHGELQGSTQDNLLDDAASLISSSNQTVNSEGKKTRRKKKREVELDTVGELVGVRDGFEGF
jgi:DNA gyrase/topoisomerase IV subunit A